MAKGPGYILFIVEGPTDEMSLGRILSKLFLERDGNAVKFAVMHTDLLTRNRFSSVPGSGSSATKVRDKIRNEVLSYIDRQRIGWKDLSRIAYITDTDGVFVPDNMVVLDESCDHVRYGVSEMRSCRPEDICARNHKKARSLLQLCGVSDLTYKRHHVPFAVYYFSRNLEHALHGEVAEQSRSEKVDLAREFSLRYSRDVPAFCALLEELCPEGDYRETWNYITRDAHSLERSSNLYHAL